MLQPEWAKAAEELAKSGNRIKLAKVEATEEKELAGRFKVNGYPTIVLFRNGKQYEYKGPREAEGIVKYMKKQVGPASKELKSVEQVQNFVSDKEEDYSVVGFFASATSPLQSSFVINANNLRDSYRFGKVSNLPEVARHFNVPEDADCIVAFKQFDERVVFYRGDSRTKALESFIVENALPIVVSWRLLLLLFIFRVIILQRNVKSMIVVACRS